jgi:hypothetical protein
MNSFVLFAYNSQILVKVTDTLSNLNRFSQARDKGLDRNTSIRKKFDTQFDGAPFAGIVR